MKNAKRTNETTGAAQRAKPAGRWHAARALLPPLLLALVAGLLAAPAGATAPDPAPDWSASGEITHAWFGSAVSTTGDVNGDGLSDLIVGAGNYGSQRGRIRIYYGAAAGMDSLADWTRNGAQGNQGLGVSVSTAGDVNGDGYDDFLAGSPYFTGTNAEEGKLHLYFGSPGGPVEAAEYTQGQLYAHLGMSVAGGGDFDGDGYDDFAVGAPLLENSQLDEGGVLVFYGRANQAPATYEQWLQPNIASASFGASVSVAGDVNGDGYDDLIVGAPKYAGAGTERGAAFVYLGGPNGLGPNPLWTKVAAQDGSHLGASVAGAGDVNGDGYADVLVGGPDAGNLQQGQAWLYRGGAAGPEVDPFWIGTVSQASAHFGAAVATAGDFDGDGYADVVVGAPGYNGAGGADEGLARLYRGSIGGLVLVREHTCGQPVAGFGVAVATGGDVDGDGFSDLLIGAGRWDGSQQDEGRVFLYRGHARTLAGNPEWSWNGQPASYVYDRQPPSSCSGDWNGDGRSDIAIGDPHAPEQVGRVDVFYGSSAGPSGAPGWSFVGDSYHVHLGRSVAAGDLDGDGYDELLVSAPGSLYENAGPGRVFVFRGGPSGLSGSPDLVLEGEQDGSLFGHGLAWAGDVDGDGYGDVVVGAPRHGSVDAPSGRLLLYRGDPDALLHPAPLVADGAPGERLGHTISAPCDFDGDGYGDWAVGSPDARDFGNRAGNVHVYFGGESPNLVPDVVLRGGTNPTAFGWSVLACDLTGDGRSDLLIGEPYYDDGSNQNRGQVILYLGTATGLSLFPLWGRVGEIDNGNLGYALASAGDVNGDGREDLLIGEPGYGSDPSQEQEGRIHLFVAPLTLQGGPAWTKEGGKADARLGSVVARAGDVTGDGFADFLGGGRMSGPGDDASFFVQFGGGRRGVERPLAQKRGDGSGIRLLGGTRDDAFRILWTGRSAAGRDRIRLEREIASSGQPFSGGGEIVAGPLEDTGAPVQGYGSRIVYDETIAGQPAGGLHWRVRVRSRSPFFPGSPWFTLAGNAAAEDDIRVTLPAGAGLDGASGNERLPGALRIAGANPFRDAASIAYTLSTPARVDLAVFDAGGRKVAQLVDGERPAGRHLVDWAAGDGSGGRTVPSGIYFVRLSVGSSEPPEVLRITRAR